MKKFMIDFAKELNSEQLDVVEHGDGPCLVLAGAGSGKTRTITYRVAYLLEKGIKPENILLVTFTNKAAGEMKTRVAELVHRGSEKKEHPVSILPWSGTFHHIGYRMLRQYAPVIGYPHNFTVLDADDSESILKISVKEVKPPENNKRFPSAGALMSAISFSRNAEQKLSNVIEERFPQWLQFLPEIERAAADYEKRKKESKSMDFDDLLVNVLKLLQDEKIVTKFSEQFHYILVDEYQDTNSIQAAIIRKLSGVYNNVLVVGDDAQSIYSFRAASIENILNFEKEYPGSKIFKLETNYRSTEEILALANGVIENNTEQYKKHLKTTLKGSLPELHPQIDQQSEGQFVAGEIEKLLKDGTPASEIAVLFRAAYHSQMLEVELVRRGIPYDYRGGVRFFERSHIKDILAYLRILNNHADTASWLRVLLHEEGIGQVAAQKIFEYVKSLQTTGEIENIGEQILNGRALVGWNNFLSIWRRISSATVKSPTALIDAIVNSPYLDYLEAEFVDSRERLQDIKQLALYAEKYDDLSEFLANTTLQESFALPSPHPNPLPKGEGNKGAPSPQRRGQGEVSYQNGQGEVSNKIVLSTIHQAKGLEWEAVFIINLATGAFPNDRSMREAKGMEEERRLFYVAITRAKKLLYLTYPMAGGAFGDFLSGPSPFLSEISTKLIEDHSLLSVDSTVLDDDAADVHYVSEEPPKRFRPGSFLKDIDDL